MVLLCTTLSRAHVHMHAHTNTHEYILLYSHIQIHTIHTHTYIYTHFHIHILSHTYTYSHIKTHLPHYAHILTHLHILMHTYICCLGRTCSLHSSSSFTAFGRHTCIYTFAHTSTHSYPFLCTLPNTHCSALHGRAPWESSWQGSLSDAVLGLLAHTVVQRNSRRLGILQGAK